MTTAHDPPITADSPIVPITDDMTPWERDYLSVRNAAIKAERSFQSVTKPDSPTYGLSDPTARRSGDVHTKSYIDCGEHVWVIDHQCGYDAINKMDKEAARDHYRLAKRLGYVSCNALVNTVQVDEFSRIRAIRQ